VSLGALQQNKDFPTPLEQANKQPTFHLQEQMHTELSLLQCHLSLVSTLNSTHSFQSGANIAAKQANVPDTSIGMLGIMVTRHIPQELAHFSKYFMQLIARSLKLSHQNTTHLFPAETTIVST